MNILLTGASGFIGRNLQTRLETLGHRVRPLSRRTGVDFARMLAPDDWTGYLTDIDVVINSVGIIGETRRQTFDALHTLAPIALFRACARGGVRRVVQISALGTDDSAFSAYHLSKRAADDCLRDLDLDWFVLRPSLIYGRGGGSAEFFLRMARLPRIPVIGDGQQGLQPIHISDVVATVIRCLDYAKSRQTIDIAGDESIAFADWLSMMRRAQGLPPAAFLRIPYSLATAIARLGQRLFPLLQPDNLRMLRVGYRADSTPLAEFLGRPPLVPRDDLFFADAGDARNAR